MAVDSATLVDNFHVNDVISFPSVALARLFVHCGADVNAQDQQGKHSTSHHCQDITIQSVILKTLHQILLLLVNNGAHVDMCNHERKTPLETVTQLELQRLFLRTKHEAVPKMHCSSSSEEIWPLVQRSCPYITWGFHSCALIEMKMLFNPFLIHAHVYKSWYCFLQHCVALQHFKNVLWIHFYSCMYVVGNTWL